MTTLRDFTSNTGAGITTVPRPAGTVNGDVLVVHAFAQGGAVAMAGWNAITSNIVGGAYHLHSFWKLAAGGDPANFSLTGAGTKLIAVCTAWYTANTATPIDGVPTVATGSPVASVTTSVDLSQLVVASVSNTAPTISGMTLITTVDYAAAIYMQLKRESISPAGATGARTTDGVYNTMMFAVMSDGSAPIASARNMHGLLLPV